MEQQELFGDPLRSEWVETLEAANKKVIPIEEAMNRARNIGWREAIENDYFNTMLEHSDLATAIELTDIIDLFNNDIYTGIKALKSFRNKLQNNGQT